MDFNLTEEQSKRKKEYDDLFKKSPFPLDDYQKTAIITDDKHNLVVAGAGSGKTEVLITRIAYLIKRKSDTIKPNRILVLAFNKNAVDDIKKRLEKRYEITDVEVRTFHGLGRKILGKYPETCDYKEEIEKHHESKRCFLTANVNNTFEWIVHSFLTLK